MLNVYIYKIEKTKLDNSLPRQIIKHVNKYTNKQGKNDSLFAWTKAYDLLVDYDFNFDCLSFNKIDEPVIAKSKIYFSLSHSDKKVAIAISDCPVGVDIQKKIDLKKTNFLAPRILNKKTLKQYKTSKNKQMFFTKEFCKLESVYKLKHFANKQPLSLKQFNVHCLENYAICVINKKNDVININELEIIND